MTPDIFGPPSHQPFAFYDPESLSVRTSQDTLLSDSTGCSVTLPRWGSMSGGALYELPTPGHLTNAHGSSGLPTPTSTTMNGTGREASEIERRRKNGDYVTLPDALSLLPTPAVNDMGAGKTPEQWDSWTAEMQQRHANGNGHGRSLSIEAQRLLPTPTTDDASNTTRASGEYQSLARAAHNLLPTPMSSTYEQGGDGGELRAAIMHGPTRRLLPTPTSQDGKQNALNQNEAERNPHTMWAVMHRLTGEPTSLPSDDGKQSTGLHPGQLTIEDA